MSDHDNAMAWAQSNPDDPRSKDVMAKAWASQNPEDPRSAQIMQKLGQADAYKSPGETDADPTSWDNTKARLSDPNQYLAKFLGKGPAVSPAEKQANDFNSPGAMGLAMPIGGSLASGAGKIASEFGGVAQGTQTPSTILKAAEFVNASAPRRIAAQAALGAGQAAYNGQNPVAGAVAGGAVGTAGEAAGGVVGLLGKGMRMIGGPMAGLKPASAAAYADNPQLAEGLADKFTNDPKQFESDLTDQLSAAKNKLNDVTAPQRDAFARLGIGKMARVQPDQYQGTAAGDEINRSWATRAGTQDNAGAWDRSMGREVPQAPAQPPSHNITLEQLENARRASDAAANLKAQTSPNQQLPANDADFAAANKLRNARNAIIGDSQATIRSPGGDVKQMSGTDLADALSEASNANERVNRLGSGPGRILTDSEAPGTLSTRALADYLDKQTGSNFTEQARALAAGKQVGSPIEGMWANALRPVGKTLLKTSTPAMQSGATVQQATPAANSALLNALFGSGASK